MAITLGSALSVLDGVKPSMASIATSVMGTDCALSAWEGLELGNAKSAGIEADH